MALPLTAAAQNITDEHNLFYEQGNTQLGVDSVEESSPGGNSGGPRRRVGPCLGATKGAKCRGAPSGNSLERGRGWECFGVRGPIEKVNPMNVRESNM